MGLPHIPQIAIGGRNKYLLNGHVAQPNRIQNMFHSVGLNINNPHFLIMQGRITKVLNMKPMEILGLIEEVASSFLPLPLSFPFSLALSASSHICSSPYLQLRVLLLAPSLAVLFLRLYALL